MTQELVAQSVEQCTFNAWVLGSSPSELTTETRQSAWFPGIPGPATIFFSGDFKFRPTWLPASTQPQYFDFSVYVTPVKNWNEFRVVGGNAGTGSFR